MKQALTNFETPVTAGRGKGKTRLEMSPKGSVMQSQKFLTRHLWLIKTASEQAKSQYFISDWLINFLDLGQVKTMRGRTAEESDRSPKRHRLRTLMAFEKRLSLGGPPVRRTSKLSNS